MLYVAYWGALEPLGRALLLPSVKALAAGGAQITLLTFEKPEDATPEAVAALRQDLETRGITWIAARYHHKPQAPATLLDIAQGCARVLASQGLRKFHVVHGRTMVGGAIGRLLAPLLRARFVFHAEGYWAQERVDAGTWKPGGRAFRVADGLERRLFDRADAIICLSYRAREELNSRQAARHSKAPIVVAPSCVDLNFFDPALVSEHRSPAFPAGSPGGEPLRFVYAGTVGGEGKKGVHAAQPGVANRYRLDWMGRLVARARVRGLDARLHVLTRAPEAVVSDILGAAGLEADCWQCESAGAARVLEVLAQSHAGLHLLSPGLAAHAGSPTKVGEYWAMGLPVVLTPGSGDTEDIVRREGVGVVLSGPEPAALDEALDALVELLGDTTLASRCRLAAQGHYNLQETVSQQLALYAALTA